MSATQSWFGADALNLRSTRSGAGRASWSRRVVTGPPCRWLAPTSPAWRISRAIRLRPCCSPRPCNSACTRGAPICLARTGVHRAHSLQQRRVGRGMGRWRAVNPGVVARLGHAEHARHGGNWEAGLVGAHEPEEPDGTAPVSRANQAAAFDKISRSTRSCLFSRRSRASSSRSVADKPATTSSRRPSCLSATAAQTAIDCAVWQ